MSEHDLDELTLARDAETLHKFGYKQELARRMSGFGNFAMSFMVIGMFWALTVNMQQGLSTAGMFGVTVMWVAGSVVAYCTAASLGEIASAIPTAGGLYHWSTALGGRGWGWATAWINLLAYVLSQGATAVAAYLMFNHLILGAVFHIDTSSWGFWQQLLGVTVIMIVWGIFNHIGVRTLARIGEIGAYLSLIGTAVLIGMMLVNAKLSNLSGLFTYTNYTGPAGGDVVPFTSNPILVCGYAMLLPMWIITSYDASAHVSEETVDAARSVPRAMTKSVWVSGLLGLVSLVIFGLAMTHQAAIAKQGADAFSTLFQEIKAPELLKQFVVVSVTITVLINGACCLTGFSRAIYSFSRDGGIPRCFSKVSDRFKTPATAIWGCVVVSIAVTLYSSAFNALAAGTALFYQICYGMAIAAALLSRNRTYGPFRLGSLSKPFGLVGILGGIFIVWVGMQPPTEVLVNYCIGFLIALIVGWYGLERRRFKGPPLGAFKASKFSDSNVTSKVPEAAND